MSQVLGDISISINNGPAIEGTLTIDQEMVDVTVSAKTEPDMRWEHVDQRGHFHAWTEDGKLPTLDARSEHVDCSGGCGDEDCEGYDVTVYACAICGEVVEPGTVTTHPVGREFAPGLKSWQVEVAQDLEHGQRVSVRATGNERVWFGLGVVAYSRAEFSPEGRRFSAIILGSGQLGEREARAKAPA